MTPIETLEAAAEMCRDWAPKPKNETEKHWQQWAENQDGDELPSAKQLASDRLWEPLAVYLENAAEIFDHRRDNNLVQGDQEVIDLAQAILGDTK